MNKLACLLIVVLLCGCSRDEVIVTESKTLNTMLKQAPLERVDLDQHPIDTVYAERFIHFNSPALLQQEVFISNPVSLVHTDRFFYVITRHAPFIVQFDRKGNLVTKISREGRGPNEFDIITNVAKNNHYIFITDGGNARINVYDHAMDYQRSFSSPNVELTLISHYIELPATDEYMLLKTTREADNLISLVGTDSNQRRIRTFFPRLIPPGQQPQAVNNFLADISDDKIMVVAYVGLPYLFLFDDTLRHNYTIVLETEKFAGHIPSLDPETDVGQERGVRVITTNITWIESNYLMVVNSNIITILKKDRASFSIQGRYKLEYEDPEVAAEHDYGVLIRIIDLDEQFMYLTSSFDDGVYRFPLTKIGL